MPSKVTMPRPFMSPARPLKSWSTTFCLRPWLTAKSTTGWPAWTPNSLAPATVRTTLAVSRNSLAGTQPRCRHVPPTLSVSTTATRRPAAAPYRAVA